MVAFCGDDAGDFFTAIIAKAMLKASALKLFCNGALLVRAVIIKQFDKLSLYAGVCNNIVKRYGSRLNNHESTAENGRIVTSNNGGLGMISLYLNG